MFTSVGLSAGRRRVSPELEQFHVSYIFSLVDSLTVAMDSSRVAIVGLGEPFIPFPDIPVANSNRKVLLVSYPSKT